MRDHGARTDPQPPSTLASFAPTLSAGLAVAILAACGSTASVLGAGAVEETSARRTCGNEVPHQVEPLAVPEDLEVRFSSGPVHADWGPRYVATLEPVMGPAGGRLFALRIAEEGGGLGEGWQERVIFEGMLEPEDLAELHATIERQRLFDQPEGFFDPTVMDGATSQLQVTAAGRSHTITVTNASSPAVDAVVRSVEALQWLV